MYPEALIYTIGQMELTSELKFSEPLEVKLYWSRIILIVKDKSKKQQPKNIQIKSLF